MFGKAVTASWEVFCPAAQSSDQLNPRKFCSSSALGQYDCRQLSWPSPLKEMPAWRIRHVAGDW